MSIEPTIVVETVNPLFENGLVQLISTKQPTDGCETAAKTRITFENYPFTNFNEVKSPTQFDEWMLSKFKGVELNVEIKTALFLCKDEKGIEFFLACHIPANKNLESNGNIKNAVKELFGITIKGDLDKNRALSKLNSAIIPLLEDFKNEDIQVLEELLQDPNNTEKYPTNIRALEAHIENPSIKFGELNPWTLQRIQCLTKDEEWQKLGVEKLNILHLVDEELILRQGVSTTNAGSGYISMALNDTSKAFLYIKEMLKQVGEENAIKAYAISRDKQKNEIQ